MEAMLLFQAKAILWMVVFWTIYRVFLSRETFYIFNRYFLLSGILLPLVLPFVQYNYEVLIEAPASTGPVDATRLPAAEEPVSLWLIGGLVIYGIGILFLLVRHLAGLVRIRRIISHSVRERQAGYQVIQNAGSPASFSVFNYIIMSESAVISPIEKRLILEHELAHVRQKHWIDLVVGQLVCLVQWFNPLSWMLLRAIRQNHEYLADEAVLKNGNSVAVYKATLINQSLGVPAIALASSFAPRQPLHRIHMMAKPASSERKKIGSTLLLPALGLFVWAFAKPVYIIQETPMANKPATRLASVTSEISPKAPSVSVSKPNKELTAKQIKPKPEVVARSVSLFGSTFNVAERDSNMALSASSASKVQPIYLLDGAQVDEAVLKQLNTNDIKAVAVYKDSKAVAMFGEKARQGAILITTKKEAQ